MDQNLAEVAVPVHADAKSLTFAASRMLSGHKCEPGGELPRH